MSFADLERSLEAIAQLRQLGNWEPMDAIVYVAWPLVLAVAGVFAWTFLGHDARPVSRKAKIIIGIILAWSAMPLVGFLALLLLGAMGGRLGG
jgi:hypothetical protein